MGDRGGEARYEGLETVARTSRSRFANPRISAGRGPASLATSALTMSHDRPAPLTVGPARPDEWGPAVRLAVQQRSGGEQFLRAANAVEMVRQGELDPAGVVVARCGREVLGALVCTPVAGAGGLIWPPQTGPHPDQADIEDRLVRHAVAWLR